MVRTELAEYLQTGNLYIKKVLLVRGVSFQIHVICKWRNLILEGYIKLKESMSKGSSYICFLVCFLL